MANEYIYRVIVKTTSSLQPRGNLWQQKTVYCGLSLRDARIAYLRNEAEDFSGGFGNQARQTVIEKHDAEPENIESIISN